MNKTEGQHSWLVDVLTDLRSYAVKNDLVILEREMADVINTAKREVAEKNAKSTGKHNGTVRAFSRLFET